jgi:tRNA-splicing ligase RtcB
MFEMNSKYGVVKVFATTIEDEAIGQITEMANSPLGENAHIRIMPDAHAGAGCTIGTTMKITDKVCPNLIGVDIGCGVDLMVLQGEIDERLPELDKIIRENIPYGMNVHEKQQLPEAYFSDNLFCWNKLDQRTKETAVRSLGTLGGGNHFIEAYGDGTTGAIAVHSGSRNIGYKVAAYYQKLAEKQLEQKVKVDFQKILQDVAPTERESFIRAYKEVNPSVKKDLAFLTGEDMENYLHDMRFMQNFAIMNRLTMLSTIRANLGEKSIQIISSTHNYISDNNILRKGAISAQRGELLVIPLNMRDGILVCRGLGNEDWNYSAPHGAGRLYSRSKAKELFSVEDYKMSMEGIYTTCVNASTLDEAPFAYKEAREIEEAIKPTVIIEDRMIPIYNFKAN